MNAHAPAAMAVLACAAMLAPTRALADPRGIGEPPPLLTPELIEARRGDLAQDMAAWLPRLVGQYTVEGVADFNGTGGQQAVGGAPSADFGSLEGGEGTAATDEGNPIDPLKQKGAGGRADCMAIGQGPGVHCVFHVTWVPEWTPLGNPVEGGVPFLAPAMKLFGLDPNTPSIMQLQLDTDGVAELESASLKGSTVRWIYETRCESDTHADARCRRVTRFYTTAGSNRIQLTIEFEKWSQDRADWLPESTFNLDMLRAVADRPGR
jgi:hypothetical protein